MTPGLTSYYESLASNEGKQMAMLASQLDDREDRNYMQFFNCNPEWPICLYDFSFRNKCPTYFAFRVGKPLASYVIDDYFYGSDQDNPKAVSGKTTFKAVTAADASQLLIERNKHLCCNTDYPFFV